MILAGILTGIADVTGSDIAVQVVSAVINVFITPLVIAYSYFLYKSLKSMKGVGATKEMNPPNASA